MNMSMLRLDNFSLHLCCQNFLDGLMAFFKDKLPGGRAFLPELIHSPAYGIELLNLAYQVHFV